MLCYLTLRKGRLRLKELGKIMKRIFTSLVMIVEASKANPTKMGWYHWYCNILTGNQDWDTCGTSLSLFNYKKRDSSRGLTLFISALVTRGSAGGDWERLREMDGVEREKKGEDKGGEGGQVQPALTVIRLPWYRNLLKKYHCLFKYSFASKKFKKKLKKTKARKGHFGMVQGCEIILIVRKVCGTGILNL